MGAKKSTRKKAAGTKASSRRAGIKSAVPLKQVHVAPRATAAQILASLPASACNRVDELIARLWKSSVSQPSRARETRRQEHDTSQESSASAAVVPSEREDRAAPVDWHAEARKSAAAHEQSERLKGEWRSFDFPQSGMKLPAPKPACPFERCEPGWGVPPGVFPPSKRGRIEKTVDGEVIRWTSNHCYQILVTPNILHRGMNKCVAPLGKKSARGDLFDHMNDVPPPEERGFDVP